MRQNSESWMWKYLPASQNLSCILLLEKEQPCNKLSEMYEVILDTMKQF